MLTLRSAIRMGVLLAVAALLAAACIPEAPGSATGPPSRAYFDVETAIDGLDLPMAVRFTPAGRVFVAERRGVVKSFDSLDDTSPTVVIDLSAEVSTMWDRALSGLAVDPAFESGRPYIYVLYSYDAPLGGTAPAWPDECTSSGFGNDGICGITSGRLERIEVGPGGTAVDRKLLLWDWCQQFGGHSVDDLGFGPEGALYASGGDGASFNDVDHGQFGGNPCDDPVLEGGMLRAQDARTTADPTGLSGTIVRIHPDTGEAWPTNPWAGDPDPNRARIIAFGLRNAFRFAFSDHHPEMVIGDVGWNRFEEINTLDVDALDQATEAPNYGWPCFEGPDRPGRIAQAGLPLCESLNFTDTVAPDLAYAYADPLTPYCAAGGSSVTGLAPADHLDYPAPFDHGVFMADYSRRCIVFFPEHDGEVDWEDPKLLLDQVWAVDLQTGPGDHLYFADIVGGTIARVVSTGTNRSPDASVTASAVDGALPLDASFDASASSDPDDDSPLSYSWDTDDDGDFDDAFGETVDLTFTEAGNHPVRMRVKDPLGASDTATVLISAGNTFPIPRIWFPSEGTYSAGAEVPFWGTADDSEDGPLPPTAYEWDFTIHHCAEGACHEHDVGDRDGVINGTFEMPQHDDSFLRITLTVTDSFGATASTNRDIQMAP